MPAIIILILALLCGRAWSLEIITDERLAALPPDAAAIIEPLRLSADRLITEARTDLDKERREHLEDLRDELEKYTRRGKLEPVLAIQRRLDELTVESVGADLLGGPVSPVAPIEGDPPPLPSTAARKAASYEKALQRLAYDVAKELYGQRDDAVRDLAKLMSDMTKSGQLDAANLVKTEHDALADLYLSPDFLGPLILLPMGGNVLMGDAALTEHGATVTGCGSPELLVDGNSTQYGGHSGFSSAAWPCAITTDLQKAYALRQIRLLLWDGNNRHYQYTLEVSPDGENWMMAADCSTGEWRSWQTIDLPRPLPIRFIRVNGLFNSDNAFFHLVELEAYCIPPKEAATPRFTSVPAP
jgi:hypothetical protein